MSETRQRFYQSVAANTAEVDEYTPAAGNFYITLLGGDSGSSIDTSVQIIWDYGGTEELLFATHQSSQQPVQITLTADGTKKLAIVLTNDQSIAVPMGAYWIGESI